MLIMSEETFKIAFVFNNANNIFHKICIDGTDYDLKNEDESGIKYFEIPENALDENGKLNFTPILVTKKNVKNDETDEKEKQNKEYVMKNQIVKLDKNKNFFLINDSLNNDHKTKYNATSFESSDEFNKAVKDSYTTFVIVADKAYDINHYQMLINNAKNNNETTISNHYGTQAFDFTFDKENNEYKFAVVTFPINLNKKQLCLYSNDPKAGNPDKSSFKNQQHLQIYPEEKISNDTKFVQIVLAGEHHVDLVETSKKGELNFSPLEEEMAKLAGIDIESVTSHEAKNFEFEEEEEDKSENDNTTENNENDNPSENNDNPTKNNDNPSENNDNPTKNNDNPTKNNDNPTENNENGNAAENDKIQLIVTSSITNVKANAFLLDGDFYRFDDKIRLDKNKKYKLEPAHYDAKKQKYYYFPKSYVYEFNTDNINKNLSEITINDNTISVDNLNLKITSKPIYHENQANTELSFGAIFTAGIIICSIFLGIGILAPIIAGPLIAGCTILAAILFGKGGYDNSKIYTPPEENKSQEPETEYSSELNPTFNQGNDDPIWNSVKSNSQNSIDGDEPLFETSDNDIFKNSNIFNGEEEDWGDNVI